MKKLGDIMQEFPLIITSTFNPVEVLRLLLEVRKDALESAEAIARKDGHEETGDKIMALQKVP